MVTVLEKVESLTVDQDPEPIILNCESCPKAAPYMSKKNAKSIILRIAFYLTITLKPVAPKRFIPGNVIVVMLLEILTVWFVLVAC